MTETIQISIADKIALITEELKKNVSFFIETLPNNISVESFITTIKAALVKNIALVEPQLTVSLLNACKLAAVDGLMLDGREAALVSFFNKKINKNEIQYMPMVAGILKKIRNSGELASLSAHVVYENDSFDYCLGDNESITHKPIMTNRGNIICAYCIVHTKDGAIYREVMTKEDIDYIRGMSKTEQRKGDYKTIWDLHYAEMAKKTVIRRLSKRLPMSIDVRNVVERDDNLYEMEKKMERMEFPKASIFALNSQISDLEKRDDNLHEMEEKMK